MSPADVVVEAVGLLAFLGLLVAAVLWAAGMLFLAVCVVTDLVERDAR